MARYAFVAVVLLGWFAAETALAQAADLRRGDENQAGAAAAGIPEENAPLEVKRAWIEHRLLQEFRGSGAAAEIPARVAAMSPQRIDQLVEIHRKRLNPEAQQQQQRLAQREQLARTAGARDAQIAAYQQRLAAARAGAAGPAASGGPVGYAPIITWLPEGASLGVGAVVSPDRRYVRINAMPFFSSIPEVHTFNFRTGEYRTIYRQGESGGNSGRSAVDPWTRPTPGWRSH